jgi:uncharacterized protein (DUF362 family)
VERLLDTCGARFSPGQRVLVKPNLVSRANAGLSCTHPAVAAALCAALLDRGSRVLVADSPAFGSAERVARACGLAEALLPLGLRVRTLDRPAPVALTCGGSIGVSRTALEADGIVSLAKVKAHGQFRATASVKNLFGCVCGCRKALAHMRLGERPGAMESMVLDVFASLPPVVGMADGVVAMHRGGPVHGEAFPLGLLGASEAPMALDAALFPCWASLRRTFPCGPRRSAAGYPEPCRTTPRFPWPGPNTSTLRASSPPASWIPCASSPCALCGAA